MDAPKLNSRRHVTLILPVMCLSACAGSGEDRAQNDPVAPTNRTIFAGNLYVDHHVLRPIARTYASNVPTGAKRSIHSFVSNFGEPKVFVNDLLQGNVSRSWNTLQRFTINTTIGGLGLFDIAQGWGLPHHEADFGQTFGVWGIGTGPDIQLPLLGFTNVRDLAGNGIGIVANPFSIVAAPAFALVRGTSGGLGVVDGRARTLSATDSIEKSSLDEYATLRSITMQHRAAFIKDGIAGRVRPEEDAAFPKADRTIAAAKT